ncbi:MAG: PLP-dependent aminotransferase family protein [Candidatus Lambdaproteobacteria bacterium]|nr:PLP-dependent aminotransferase family protein [Candidatus Lambdaproteobacteria bacterium]
MRLVDAGELPVATRLPSIRALAQHLGVNRNTMAKAIQELGQRGYVHTRYGGGSVVTRPAGRPLPALQVPPHADVVAGPAFDAGDWERRLSRRMEALHRNHGPHQPQGAINLLQLRPYTGLFPVERFRQCLNTVLRRMPGQLLNYGAPAGYLPLREHISMRLRAQGIPVGPAEILITSGSQQGIDLVARALLDPGDAVVVESPMYSIALKIFTVNGARLLPYEIERGGLDFRELEGLLGRLPKLFYAVPNFQNPTTYSYTVAEREALLEMVHRTGSVLVEDATGAELHARPGAFPALAALERTGHVMHLNTFSKTMVPAVRAGYVAGPAPVLRRLTELKEMTDLSHSLILQGAIAEFMERGHYDEHVQAVGDFYRRRAAQAAEMLRAALPEDVSFAEPAGGLCVWVDLPAHIDADQLSQRLSEQGVLVSPAGLYQSMRGGRNGFRLCTSHESEARLRSGIEIIGRELRRTLRKPLPRTADGEYQAMH